MKVESHAEGNANGESPTRGRLTEAALQVINSTVRANRMNNSRPRTLVDLLKGAVKARPAEEVIRFKQDKRLTGLSGRALFDRVRHVALGLYDFGIRKCDRVAILAESGPLWSISDYAILSNGAVNVPIYPTQPPHRDRHACRFVTGAFRQRRRVGRLR